ncbi:MAG: MFS transporter [Candidatus Heimdallarchaeota archaeon]
MRKVSDSKLLALYASSHYLIHCPTLVFTALIFPILRHFELDFVQFGLVLTLRNLVSGLSSFLGGALSDQFSQRIFPPLSIMIIGGATLIIGLFGGTSIYLLVSCLMVMSFATALFHPSGMTTISDRFQKGRTKAFSIFSLGGQAGFGTGPLTVAGLLWLGGGVLQNWQLAYLLWSVPILCMSLIMVITHARDPTIGVNTKREAETSRKPKVSTRPSAATTSLFFPAFLILLVIMAIRGFGRNLFEPYLVPFLKQVRHISEATAVFYLSMLTLIGLPGTILGGLGGDKYGEKRVLKYAYTLAVLGLILLLLLRSPILIPLIIFILAIGQNAAMPNINSLTAKIVPLRARGKAYGLTFLFPIMLGSVAPTAAAIIIRQLDYIAVFLLAIGLYVLSILLLFGIHERSDTKKVLKLNK